MAGVGRVTLGVAEVEGVATTVTVLVLVECKVVTLSDVTVLGVGVEMGTTTVVSTVFCK
jgi:hypothetical protein